MKKHIALFIGLVAISGNAFAGGKEAAAAAAAAKEVKEVAQKITTEAPGMFTRAYGSVRDVVTSSAKYVSNKAVQAGTWAADKTAAPREAVSTFVTNHKTAVIITSAVIAATAIAVVAYKIGARKAAKKEAKVNCYECTCNN